MADMRYEQTRTPSLCNLSLDRIAASDDPLRVFPKALLYEGSTPVQLARRTAKRSWLVPCMLYSREVRVPRPNAGLAVTAMRGGARKCRCTDDKNKEPNFGRRPHVTHEEEARPWVCFWATAVLLLSLGGLMFREVAPRPPAMRGDSGIIA